MFLKYSLLIVLFFNSQNLFAADFSSFQKLLNNYLTEKPLTGGGLETSFDYVKAHSDPATAQLLKKQADILKGFQTINLTSKEQALAFWINSYNFFMVQVILTQGFKKNKLKIKSVKDLGSWLNPYAVFKQKQHDVGGKKMSLDQIEKKTLLGDDFKKKGWKDARVHFAVNCASVGCPPLIKKVYEAQSLDQTLDNNIIRALKTPRHLNIKGDEAQLTHLFKWYKNDFKEHSGSIRSFIKKYLKDPKTTMAFDKTKDIEYLSYDWSLNSPAHFK